MTVCLIAVFYHSKVANKAAEPGIREGARPL